MNQSISFFDALTRLWEQPVPEKVMTRARKSLLDYLAVTCAGSMSQKDKLDTYWTFAEPEPGRFRVIGSGKRAALKEAVFLNGLNAHALDYDDGTNSGIIHLGSPIFSLLLPLSERYQTGLQDLLKAAIVGYEASYTMAVSIQPGHKALGYHATGTCGVIGAAIAAGLMLGLSRERRFAAFSAACIAASGMLKAFDEGSELKPYNVAKTALLSLTALQLGAAGFKGPEDPLGGRGFLKIMTGREDIKLKPLLLNDTYAIEKSYTKPYASCRYTHPAVEAAIHLGRRISPEEVQRIIVKTYGLAIPGHDHTVIAGSYSAKMSIPYAVAVALLYGKAGLTEFDEAVIRREEVNRLIRLVRVDEDETLSRAFPSVQAAAVTVITSEGDHTERVDYPKGEPENPLSETEFRERYLAMMTYAGISDEVSQKIYQEVSAGDGPLTDLLEKL